jgi:hypothetical protein
LVAAFLIGRDRGGFATQVPVEAAVRRDQRPLVRGKRVQNLFAIDIAP